MRRLTSWFFTTDDGKSSEDASEGCGRSTLPRWRDSGKLASSMETVEVCLLRETSDTVLGFRLVYHDPKGNPHGAKLASVDPYTPAWLEGLEAGDLITTVQVAGGERHQITDGYAAHAVLESAQGEVLLRLRRRRWHEADFAAQRLQAAWRGKRVRLIMASLEDAAQLIQARWRAWPGRLRYLPSILALPYLSSSSSLGSSSRGCSSRRESHASSSGQASSSHSSRRESFHFQE